MGSEMCIRDRLNTCLVYSKNLHLKKYMLDFIEQIEALYAESGLE